MKLIKTSMVILLVIALLACCYVWLGMADSQTHVDYHVSLDTQSGYVDVTMTINPHKKLFLDLYLRDRYMNGSDRISNFTCSRENDRLLSFNTVPFAKDTQRIYLGFSSAPITVSYRIDPVWKKGRSVRSYLGSEFGFVRGMTTFYTPRTLEDVISYGKDVEREHAGTATVRFDLSTNWLLNAPWKTEDTVINAVDLRNVYFGLGPFEQEYITSNGVTFSLGIYKGLPDEERNMLASTLFSAFNEISGMMQFAPSSHAEAWCITVFPSEPIHGGAAGTNSLIAENDLSVLIHEMFHWWNGHTLKFTKDAGWICEGFTTYYQGKVLYETGDWTLEEFTAYIDHIYGRLFSDGQAKCVNLANASSKVSKLYDDRMARKMYDGGALLAYVLDKRLQQNGGSLDEIWKELNKIEGAISTKDFIAALENISNKSTAEKCTALVYGHEALSIGD